MEILAESALHESRDRFAKLDEAKSESVATHGRDTHSFGDALDYRWRRREIGITGSEVDDIDPSSDELTLLLGDSSEWIFG